MSRGNCKFETMDMSDGLFNKEIHDEQLMQPELQDIECKELDEDISLEQFAEDIEIKGMRNIGKYLGDKLATGALFGVGSVGASKLVGSKIKEKDQTPPVKVRVTVENKKKNAEIKRKPIKKQYNDELVFKELSSEIETKSIVSEGLNIGRKVLGRTKQGINWAKGGNRFKQGVAAVAKKKPVNENPLFRQFNMGKQGVQVQHQTGRLSKTPMQMQKLKASKRSNRRLLLGGSLATGAAGTAYGVGKIQGEHQARQRRKTRPYWMDNQEME